MIVLLEIYNRKEGEYTELIHAAVPHKVWQDSRIRDWALLGD